MSPTVYCKGLCIECQTMCESQGCGAPEESSDDTLDNSQYVTPVKLGSGQNDSPGPGRSSAAAKNIKF